MLHMQTKTECFPKNQLTAAERTAQLKGKIQDHIWEWSLSSTLFKSKLYKPIAYTASFCRNLKLFFQTKHRQPHLCLTAKETAKQQTSEQFVFTVIGKMCDKVFTNNSVGEGMGVNGFEMGLKVSTNCKQQVGVRTSLNFGTLG